MTRVSAEHATLATVSGGRSLVHGKVDGHHMAELVRLLPIGAAMFDTELNYLAASKYWVEAFGITGDFLGRHHYEVLTDIRDEWRELLEAGLRGTPSHSDCDPYPRNDGSVQYVRWRIEPWTERDGVQGGLFIFNEDITQQEMFRRRLEENEHHLESLFEHSPIGLNLCRMDGLWLESNQAFLDIIGYSAEEADGGLTYWELTPRKYDAEEEVQLKSLAETRRYGPYEKEFIRKDGSLIPVRLNGFIVEREGEEFIWSLIEDMRERRKLERALEQERLSALQSSKLATLGEMAAGIAHELNNPLAIIDSSTHVVEYATESSDASMLSEAVDSIRDAVARASHIVTGLLRFARESNSGKKLPAGAKELLDEALGLTRSRLENHGIEVEVAIQGDGRVLCNPIEFAQVLINLINNAFDAIRDREEKWLRVEASDDGQTMTILVTDSGTGLDPAIIEDVFTPFYTTKEVGKGTGLGLSISKGIIEGLDGRLELCPDAPNTQFRIEVPLDHD